MDAGPIFLSYSRRDREYAMRLAAYLELAGLSVWWDSDISVGTNFADTIQQRIEQCAAMVVVLTPAAVNSVWVLREILYAQELGKKLFPLLLEESEIPLTLASIQYADVRGGALPDAGLVARLGEATPQPVQHSNVEHPLRDPSAKKVFISYRRADAAYPAHWLYRELNQRFRDDPALPTDAFFIDVDAIALGRRFKETVEKAIQQCQAMLVVIGDRWITAKSRGKRRLDDEEDLLRLEIELALDNGLTIVPILLDPAVIPERRLLPASIQDLSGFQGMKFYPDRFADNADFLTKQLKDIIG